MLTIILCVVFAIAGGFGGWKLATSKYAAAIQADADKTTAAVNKAIGR